MAFYGIVSAGNLSGSNAADSITFNNTTARVSASTVLGLDGADLIYLGAQGYTAAASAKVYLTAAAASSTGGMLTAQLNGSGTYATSTSVTAALSGGTTALALLTGVITSQRGTRSLLASQIYGNAGNDTIMLGGQLNTITSSTIGGGAGNDTISNAFRVNAATAFATSTINGFDSAVLFTANKFFLEAGGGDDRIDLRFIQTASFTQTTIGGSQGNDTIAITATAAGSGGFKTGLIALGGGDDTITAVGINTFNYSTLNGGGGKDTITVNFGSSVSASIIDGDFNGTISDYDDADLISASTNESSGEFGSVSFYGGGGNDTIHFNASAQSAGGGGAANYFALNVGDDFVSAYMLNQDTIQMGAGNDSIRIGTAALSSQFILGGGTDTITMSGDTESAAIFSGNTIFGGAGADYLSSTDGIGDDVTAGATWAMSSVTDSTLTARDTIGFGGADTSTHYRMRFTDFALYSGEFRTGDNSATNGLVTFTAGTDSSLTARAEIINGSMTTQGHVAGFQDGDGRSYVFIQGGSDGYSVTQLGDGTNTAFSAITIAGNTAMRISMAA